jgi:protein-L-isoaspartate O-methyltransferase
MRDPLPQDFWLNELSRTDNYNRWVFDTIAPFIRGRVLEIGCGIGTYSKLIAPMADHVDAVEIDSSFADRARLRLRDAGNVTVHAADFFDIEFEKPFETVVMLDVLEHILDDIGALRRIGRMLSPNGLLVAKVPALPRLYGTMDEAVGHHRRYSKELLTRTVASAGMTPKVMKSMNMPGILGWWINGRLRSHPHPGKSQVRLFERITPAVRALESVVGVPFGLSLILVAGRDQASAVA